MEEKDLSKVNASPKKPKKPFFSKSGCGCAVIVLIGFFAFSYYLVTRPVGSYRIRGFNATAEWDAKYAYTVAQDYFKDYPDGIVTLTKLANYGYVQSSEVTLTVISGSQANLQLMTSHAKGSKTYTVNSDGNISFQK